MRLASFPTAPAEGTLTRYLPVSTAGEPPLFAGQKAEASTPLTRQPCLSSKSPAISGYGFLRSDNSPVLLAPGIPAAPTEGLPRRSETARRVGRSHGTGGVAEQIGCQPHPLPWRRAHAVPPQRTITQVAQRWLGDGPLATRRDSALSNHPRSGQRRQRGTSPPRAPRAEVITFQCLTKAARRRVQQCNCSPILSFRSILVLIRSLRPCSRTPRLLPPPHLDPGHACVGDTYDVEVEVDSGPALPSSY